jgi:CO/xanthine dehydrogenase FAD-binding subunit
LFQADTVPSLLTLNAKLRLVSTEGERMVPIDEFYSGLGEVPNRISDHELLVEIHVPKPSPYSCTAYVKYRVRDTIEFPIVGVACLVTLDRERRCCQEARFAMVGHGPKPSLREATQLVAGLEEPVLTEDVIDNIVDQLKPVYHMGVSASFKRRLTRVCVKKAFLEAWMRAQKSEESPF